MNERIRELALQAGYLPDGFGIGHWDMPECKKFAELIAKQAVECVSDLMRDEQSALTYTAGAEVQARLREYFGIK